MVVDAWGVVLLSCWWHHPTPAFPLLGTCLGIVLRRPPLLYFLCPLHVGAHTKGKRRQGIVFLAPGSGRPCRRLWFAGQGLLVTCCSMLTRGPFAWSNTIGPCPFMAYNLRQSLKAVHCHDFGPFVQALIPLTPKKETGCWRVDETRSERCLS